MFKTIPPRSALVIGALAATLVTPAPGQATVRSGEAFSITLPYDRDDLATAQGAERLYRRIAIAARRVCGDAAPSIMIRMNSAPVRACRREAIEQAVRSVGSPDLAAAGATVGQLAQR